MGSRKGTSGWWCPDSYPQPQFCSAPLAAAYAPLGALHAGVRPGVEPVHEGTRVVRVGGKATKKSAGVTRATSDRALPEAPAARVTNAGVAAKSAHATCAYTCEPGARDPGATRRPCPPPARCMRRSETSSSWGWLFMYPAPLTRTAAPRRRRGRQGLRGPGVVVETAAAGTRPASGPGALRPRGARSRRGVADEVYALKASASFSPRPPTSSGSPSLMACTPAPRSRPWPAWPCRPGPSRRCGPSSRLARHAPCTAADGWPAMSRRTLASLPLFHLQLGSLRSDDLAAQAVLPLLPRIGSSVEAQDARRVAVPCFVLSGFG